MDAIIRRQFNKSFSSQDIMKVMNGEVNIIRYPDLAQFSHIDELLEPHGCAIVLYLNKPYFGHWVALNRVHCKNGKRVLEHFDPLGYDIDAELKRLPSRMLPAHVNPDGQPLLSSLVYNSGYDDVIWNNLPLQKDGNNVNTCGRHCAVRLLLREVPLEKYLSLFKKQKLDPDFYVTAMTMWV